MSNSVASMWSMAPWATASLIWPRTKSASELVGAVVHQRQGFLVVAHLLDAHRRAEGFLAHDAHAVVHVAEDLRSQVGRAGTVHVEFRGIDVGDGTLGHRLADLAAHEVCC